MNQISPSEWATYKETLESFSESVALQNVTWHHKQAWVQRFGEWDTPPAPLDPEFETRTLQALIEYNSFRKWPTDTAKDTGLLDNQFCNLFLNRANIVKQGYATPDGNLDFDPGLDRFWVSGYEYKPMGDTPVAQADYDPLYYIVILERVNLKTGKSVR